MVSLFVEDFVIRLVFILLLIFLQIAGLTFINMGLFQIIVGVLSPMIVLTASLPFSPYFGIILTVLGLLNLVRASGGLTGS